jgi:ACT domain-containing protein
MKNNYFIVEKHKAGKLVGALNIISSFDASVLTISQKTYRRYLRKISEIKGASCAKLVTVD